MKIWSRFFLMVLLCTALALSACAPVTSDLMAGVKAAERPASPAAIQQPFIQAVEDSSWRLLQASAANEGDILVSPASVYLALTMTLNGADGETRTAMMTALSAHLLNLKTLNESCRDWMTRLSQAKGKSVLTIANSIWYRNGFSADPLFLQTNADYYSAGAQMLDFGQKESLDTINGWVKEATKGTIDKILESIPPQAVMYLINSIYFKADWKTQFNLKLTVRDAFAAPDRMVDADYMRRAGALSVITSAQGQGVILPYVDENMSFFAFLPAAGQSPRDLIASLTGEQFGIILKNPVTRTTDLSLPRFEARYEDSLINELKKMGMGIAFEGGRADFSLMQKGREKDLFISEVKHKTYCRINETGTEAAAATAVEMSKTAIPEPEVKLIFNRPFLYGIIDSQTGLLLFIGIQSNPAR